MPHHQLESEFSARCQDAIRQSYDLGYPPTRMEEMLRTASARSVAKKMVISGEVHKGFQEMAKLGRKDLTLEAIMLEEKFQPLFTIAEIAAARFRLTLVP